jgi:hypothetical protein
MPLELNLETVLRILVIGAGATMVMDAWLLLLKRAGVAASNFALVGRLLGYLARGTRVRGAVAKAAPLRGESLLGWTAHYVIGVAFAAALVWAVGLDWARAPTILPALLTGIITVVAPLFILQPAMGAGIASTRTQTPLLNNLKSLANHTMFGVGLYLAALVSARVTAGWG